ncbi:MAG: hypothetical protein KatS3mg087_1356 [Patescibacteria group bacterium]|nr:MAG: hypothetical protein KatS3mg087_1356 [Patescibacteria group bacterium]
MTAQIIEQNEQVLVVLYRDGKPSRCIVCNSISEAYTILTKNRVRSNKVTIVSEAA